MISRQNLNRFPCRVAAICAVILSPLLPAPPFARAANAADTAPKVVIAGKTTPVAVAPYRDSGGAVFASVDFVQAMDASYQVAPSGDSVTISHDGRTAVFPCHLSGGQAIVNVATVAQGLGGVLQWDEASRTATILARIKMVREDADHLSVATGFPVGYRVDSADKPNRVYIDIYGATLGAPATTVPVSGDDVDAVRANQIDPATVRVVVDLKRSLAYHLVSPGGPSRVEIALTPAAPGQDASNHSAPSRAMTHYADSSTPDSGAAGGQSGASPTTAAPASNLPPVQLSRANSTTHILDIATDASTPGELHTTITVSAAPEQPYHAFLLDGPNRLVFDVPGADFALTGDLASNTAATMPLVNAMVKTIRWGLVGSHSSSYAGRVVFDLYHALSYTISSTNEADGSVQYTLNLLLNGNSSPPNEANSGGSGSAPSLPVGPSPPPVISQPLPNVPDTVLSGKTIVVDPGHGGADGGAPGVHGLWEKNITLAVGELVRDQLVACGARVIMTRADDTFIPLPVRAQMGIDNHADYFVSIHADSSGEQNSHEGTTVYYHANLATCHNLASTIAARLGQLNDGIRELGTRSDYVRFPGVGFYVLRRSPEPAVLVETGYVNSDHDASSLTDPAMQKLIAQGIVAGLKDFAVQGAGSAEQAARSSSSDSDKLALVRQGGAR